MSDSRVTRAALLSFLALAAPACVSEHVGYEDVRSAVSERTGKEIRWRDADGDARSDRAVKKLLEAPLTPDSAVQLALLNNADLQASFEELGVARAALVTALHVPNPTAEAAVRFRGEDSPALEGSVTEDLSELIALPFRNGVARAELEAAKLFVTAQALDLAFQVRVAFYDHLADRQILELRRTVVEALGAAAEVAKALHEAGNVTALDLANEQSLYEEARVNVANAETAFASSRERLNALLGLWGKQVTWEAAGRLEPPGELSLTGLEARAVERSLDLAIVRERFAAAARRANAARLSGWLPELKAGLAVEREEGEWSYGPLAEVEVPLFYQGQGEVAGAHAEMRREAQRYRARAVEVRAASRAAAERARAARERAEHYVKTLLPLRERVLSEAQLQYNAMNLSVFQLLAAKRDQVETARGYVEALREFWRARAEVEQLRSGRLPSGVATSTFEARASNAAVTSDPH